MGCHWTRCCLIIKEIAGHALGAIGQNTIYALWSGYILKFYTDVFGITGAVAGLIMLFTRIFDAANDPVMGMIADRTRTRWGRFRPWLLFSCLPAAVCLVLCFSTPNLSPTGKIVYASITYVMLSMVFTTVDVPFWSLPAAMTSDSDKRGTIFSRTRLVVTPILTRRFGTKLTYQGVHVFAILANLAFFFSGYSSMPVALVAFTITSIPLGANTVLISTMISDIIEFVEIKTGQRSEGLISSM